MLEQDYNWDDINEDIEDYIVTHEHYPDYIEGDIYDYEYDYEYDGRDFYSI